MRGAELALGAHYCWCFIITRLIVERWGGEDQTQCVGSGKKKNPSDTHVSGCIWMVTT